MRLTRFTPLLAIPILVVLAAPVRADEPKDEIRDVVQAYTFMYNSGDAEALAALYAQDAYWLPPDVSVSEPVHGRKLIQQLLAHHLQQSPSVKRKTLRIDVSGDLAYVVGTFSNHQTYTYGNFVLCLRRQSDGAWLIVSDISNKSPARPGAVPLEK